MQTSSLTTMFGWQNDRLFIIVDIKVILGIVDVVDVDQDFLDLPGHDGLANETGILRCLLHYIFAKMYFLSSLIYNI